MQNHRRYMAWNMIGVVVQREVDGRSLIDIVRMALKNTSIGLYSLTFHAGKCSGIS
jgi:hypothetical protein